jgi:predicted amidohydrolase YtcJ
LLPDKVLDADPRAHYIRRSPSDLAVSTVADLILRDGRITTLAATPAEVDAVAIASGRVLALGDDASVEACRGRATRVVDLGGRRVIPGLNDSHLHLIRGGLTYNLELRWEGVPSLDEALRMLRAQVERTPPPQWARVIGGFNALQFRERRLPTLDELNAIAPETPVFILHLYDRALLNRAALRAMGWENEVPGFPAAEVERDARGQPTGLLVAAPNAMILYAAIGKLPTLDEDDRTNSTRLFLRELNRLGITSAIDAAGGGFTYPDDYRVVEKLRDSGELTVRIAYNLLTTQPGAELEQYRSWAELASPGEGDEFLRHNGAGELLVWSGIDFEDFRQPRPDLPDAMEGDLADVIRFFAEQRWPFRLHATYDESVKRFLDVFEQVDREIPFSGLRWWFDHCETITQPQLERVAALGGGIAIQDRLAFQGEYFVERYGVEAAEVSPPIPEIRAAGIPLGAGTDATRVASYNPWVCLAWLATGRTVGGAVLYPRERRLDRLEALRLYTVGSAWFSGEDKLKGTLALGQLADLAVLSDDYLRIADDQIADITSVLTIVGGRPVHGAAEFANLAPPPPPPSPDWSPLAQNSSHRRNSQPTVAPVETHTHRHLTQLQRLPFWDQFPGHGCACFAP